MFLRMAIMIVYRNVNATLSLGTTDRGENIAFASFVSPSSHRQYTRPSVSRGRLEIERGQPNEKTLREEESRETRFFVLKSVERAAESRMKVVICWTRWNVFHSATISLWRFHDRFEERNTKKIINFPSRLTFFVVLSFNLLPYFYRLVNCISSNEKLSKESTI